MSISLISCVTFYKNQFIIGKNNDLLLNIKEDLTYFKNITSNRINEIPNVVLMGRKTWFSIPLKNRPLKNRISFVLTNDKSLLNYNKTNFKRVTDIQENVYFLTLTTFLKIYTQFKLNVFVIGGSDIYNLFLDPNINFTLRPKYLYITEVKDYFKYNTYNENDNYTTINGIPDYYKLTSVSNKMYHKSSQDSPDNGISFRFLKYTLNHKMSTDEKIYINMLRNIINNGNKRSDRTNVGTVSIFGTQMRFDISQSIPLLTTRFIPVRVIIEELLWFLRGDTDNTILQKKKVRIWDGNTSRQFLDNRGLGHYKEGILGPGYGFQMRFFGAEYSQMFADTSKVDTTKIGGFDQLKYILNLLNTDPYSRRIMMSYWNPPDFDKTALIPCFIKDTLVLTRDGYKKIQYVEDTDLLYTHNRNWKPILQKHVKLFKGDIYNIQLTNNIHTIDCTPEHPFFVKLVNVESDIDTHLHHYHSTTVFWETARNLTTNHVMCLPINKKYTLKKELIDKDLWFLLGYFVNCGSLNTFLKRFSLYVYNVENSDIFNSVYLDETMPSCRVQAQTNLGSVDVDNEIYLRHKLINALNNHFVKTTSVDDTKIFHIPAIKVTYNIDDNLTSYFEDCIKNIPEWIQDAPCGHIYEFILGFFYSYYHSHSYAYYNQEHNRIVYSLQRLYAKISNDMCVKNDAFFKNINEFNTMVNFDNNYIYYPIEKITIANNQEVDVYNFEVADDNSYTVNNVIAHNCHTNVQFYVEEDSFGDLHLSCQFYMRSNDFALANNFNVISYTILTYILALKCNMKPKEIIFTCGDTHVYNTHLQPIIDQLNRNCRPFPVLLLDESIKNKDFNNITADDFEVCGYFPHPAIKLDMAV